MKKFLNRLFWSVLALVIIGYGVIIWWFNAHELELVYSPDREMRSVPDSLGLTATRITVVSGDGVKLVGRVYRGPLPDSSATWILYFHGNAGNASRRVDFHAQLIRRGFSVLVAEYRGYGESDGSPGEWGIYDDAETFCAYAHNALGVPPEHLIFYGHSLGSAVAIELACRRKAAGLILEGAMTSVPDRGQELYPYLPVAMMATNRFDSIDKIGRLTLPKLFLHAIDDEIIPIAHGRKLFQAAPLPKTFQEVHGGHNSAYQIDRQKFFDAIGEFARSVRKSTGI